MRSEDIGIRVSFGPRSGISLKILQLAYVLDREVMGYAALCNYPFFSLLSVLSAVECNCPFFCLLNVLSAGRLVWDGCCVLIGVAFSCRVVCYLKPCRLNL